MGRKDFSKRYEQLKTNRIRLSRRLTVALLLVGEDIPSRLRHVNNPVRVDYFIDAMGKKVSNSKKTYCYNFRNTDLILSVKAESSKEAMRGIQEESIRVNVVFIIFFFVIILLMQNI